MTVQLCDEKREKQIIITLHFRLFFVVRERLDIGNEIADSVFLELTNKRLLSG